MPSFRNAIVIGLLIAITQIAVMASEDFSDDSEMVDCPMDAM